MKSILCFGDSNTYGATPYDEPRWPYDVRWTGRLQMLLGPGYRIIEEGLGGRTAAAADPHVPFRRGLDVIEMLLESHSPLDLVTIMLGTNDAKACFAGNARTIAWGNLKIIEAIQKWSLWSGNSPEILLISPILIADGAEDSRFGTYDESSVDRSRAFAAEYRHVAELKGVHFFDAATVATPGPDCLHMDRDSHKALAEALAAEVRKILG